MNDALPVPLSVLDLAPVGRGSSPAQALRNSVVLAREVEQLGYTRHWVAEHHNMPGIASSSPAVLLAHLADANRVRRGGEVRDQHGRRGARDSRHVVVLGDPVPSVPEPLREPRQVDRAGQGLGRVHPLGDGNEVEYGKGRPDAG